MGPERRFNMHVQLFKLLKPFCGFRCNNHTALSSGRRTVNCIKTKPCSRRLCTYSSTLHYHQLLRNSSPFGFSISDLASFHSGHLAFKQRRYRHQSFKRANSRRDVTGISDSGPYDTQNMLTWKFKLQKPFGTVSVKLGRPVKIDRIDVLRYPAGDHAAVHLLSGESRRQEDVQEAITLDYDGERGRLGLVDDGSRASPDERWVLEIPPYYDLEIFHSGDETDAVEIRNLENERVAVMAAGDILVHNIKSKDVTLESKNGVIRSTSVLQGNVEIKTEGDKGFQADRLQGSTLEVHTQDGSIHCRDAYCNHSSFESVTGSILLGNVTGECSLRTGGDVNVESLDGAITADICGSGFFKGYLIRPNGVSVKTEEGDISISVPSDVKCHLDLSAHDLTLPAELDMTLIEESGLKEAQGVLNGGGPSVVAASTKGSISISLQSWFDSLKLGG